MDGVLIDTLSSWRYLHQRFGTNNKRSVTAYLKGEIDYYEFMKRDIELWHENGVPTTLTTIQTLLYQLPLINGAKDCIHFLREKQVHTAIVSAGLDILAQKVATELGVEYVYANGILADTQGRLTGESVLRVELLHKDNNVKDLTNKLKIPLEQCAAVGNSCFDIPMFEACGLGVAFNPTDTCVREAADIVVEGKNGRDVLSALQPYV